MNRNRLEKKYSWTPAVERRIRRRVTRFRSDYWADVFGNGAAPGRLLAVSKLRRKAGAR